MKHDDTFEEGGGQATPEAGREHGASRPEAGQDGARRVPPPEVPGRGQEAPGRGTERHGRPEHGGPAEGAPGHTPGQETYGRRTGAGQAPGRGPRKPPGGGTATAPTPSRAATPGEPFYLPAADWRWTAALAGFIAAMAPQAVLEIVNLLAGSSARATPVTTAGAISIAISSLMLYGWSAFAAWLFSVRTSGRSLVVWGFRRPTRAYFWVVPLGLVTVYVISIVHDAIIHPHQQAIVGDFPHTAIGAVMFALVAIVMAPLFEEILFRGFLFRGLANSLGWPWAAAISAAVFGAAHLQLDVFVPLAALGFILAWAYHRTGSLWTNITMHALFNTIAVIAWILTS